MNKEAIEKIKIVLGMIRCPHKEDVDNCGFCKRTSLLNQALALLTEQPPAGELTAKIRKRWLAEALHQDSTLDYAICAIIDLCTRLDRSEAIVKEYGGQRCTAICSRCKRISHWCLLPQGHAGEHIHYCQFKFLESSRKELLTALEMCERARACGQIEKIDKIILQAAIKSNKGD